MPAHTNPIKHMLSKPSSQVTSLYHKGSIPRLQMHKYLRNGEGPSEESTNTHCRIIYRELQPDISP